MVVKFVVYLVDYVFVIFVGVGYCVCGLVVVEVMEVVVLVCVFGFVCVVIDWKCGGGGLGGLFFVCLFGVVLW